MVSVPPPGEDDGTYGSFRYGKQEEPSRVRGVLSFPDVLAPAAGPLDEASGFTSPEEAFGPNLFSPIDEEMPPQQVQLSAKAAKQRSSVTKGQRVYKATPRSKQGSIDASGYPFLPDTVSTIDIQCNRKFCAPTPGKFKANGKKCLFEGWIKIGLCLKLMLL